VFVCDKCGEEEVSIPCVPDLHKVIGRSIVSQKQPLNGKELRFLRKNAGLSATKLSKIIGVRPESISRWENENLNLKGSSDRLIRMIYCAIMEIPSKELKSLVQENFEEISKKKLTESLFKIPVNQWSNENGSGNQRDSL
jgi:DNA-binding transcriptional regulator YiaG